MSAELSARHVTFGYEPAQPVLHEVTLALPSGRLTGIVGPNGSGKSTLLRVLAGILTPQSGKVLLEDEPLHRLARLELARQLSFLPQDVSSAYRMRVWDVVAQGRFPHTGLLGFLGREDRRVVEESLARTQSSELRHRSFDELSGGERRRVLISSVLAQSPRIMLLDEPTAALDIHHQSDVFELLLSLARDGLNVTVVTHDLNLAARFCDRIILIGHGRIVRQGRPENVLQQDVLREIYAAEVMVTSHPVDGSPMIVVARRGER